MIIKTWNSTYTLTDKGDGAWEMRSTNLKYPGPELVVIVVEPSLGNVMIMRRVNPPPGRGRYIITSWVKEIVVEEEEE